MDRESMILILALVSEGIGCLAELRDLARRVERGEVITDAEIKLAREDMNAAINHWNEAADNDHA